MAQRKDAFFLAEKKSQKPARATRSDGRIKKINEGREVDPKGEDKIKRPFDKKTYRLKKYSKKYKLDKWEEQRKRKLLHNYYKEIKDDPASGSYKSLYDDDEKPEEKESVGGLFVRHPDLIEVDKSAESNDLDTPDSETVTDSKVPKKTKRDVFKKVKDELGRIKLAKLDKQKDAERAKEERRVKLLEYKKKKADRYKKLSRKTKKGQPVMTGRLELLLDKIMQTK